MKRQGPADPAGPFAKRFEESTDDHRAGGTNDPTRQTRWPADNAAYDGSRRTVPGHEVDVPDIIRIGVLQHGQNLAVHDQLGIRARLHDLDIGLAQGHLFGEPRAIKDAVLAEAGAPPSTVVQMPQRRAAAG